MAQVKSIKRRIAKSGRANVAVGAEAVHVTESGTRKYQCNGLVSWEAKLQALADKVAGRKGAALGIGIRAALVRGLGGEVEAGDLRAVDLLPGAGKAKAASKAPGKAKAPRKAKAASKAPGKAKAPRKAKAASKAHTPPPAGQGGAEVAS